MTNNVAKLFTKLALVISNMKFLSKFKIVKKILSMFGIAAVSTTAATTGANAAAVVLAVAGAISTDGNYIAADMNQTSDTVANQADAVVTIDGVSISITFNTLITAANKTLVINMVDTNTSAVGTIDATGAITASAGSTLTINTASSVLFDIGASVVETNTGNVIINMNGTSTVNTTGASAAIDATIIGVATSTLDIDAAVTFAEAVTAGILDIDGATTFTDSVTNLGTSSVGAATIFSSDLTATGAIVFDSATAVKGDLTLSSATATGISNVLTFTGSSITATAAMLSDHGSAGLTINGTGDKTIAVQITPDADDEFKLIQTAASGTVTFTKVMGVDSGTDLVLEEADFQTGSVSIVQEKLHTEILTVAGVLTLGEDANVTTNAAIHATTSTIIIDDTIANGEVIFKLGAGFTDGSIAGTDNIELPSNLDDGETFVLINGVVNNDTVNAAVVTDAQLAIMDNALRTFTVSGDTTAETITITAANNSTATVESNLGVDKNTAISVLQAVSAAKSEATALDAFTNTLNGRDFAADEDTALAQQVAPQIDSQTGSVTSSKAVTGQVQGIISNRMASLRSGDAYIKGASAGGMMSANSAFLQAFGSEAEQKTTKANDIATHGYKADTTGLAIGFDGITEGGSVIGVSLSASETDVNGRGTGSSTAAIDSYTASLYLDKATDAGYVEGSLTVGYNENENSRVIASGGLSRTYKGSYDSQQLSLRIGGGVPTEIGSSSYITPFGSLTGTQVTHKKYTESSSGADALRLTVDQDDITSVIGTVGVKAHAVTDYGTPMISLAVNSELGDDTISATNTYTGGGTAFKTTTDVEPTTATLGIGYSYGSDLVSLDIGYEAEANDDEYLSHYGSVRIVSKF